MLFNNINKIIKKENLLSLDYSPTKIIGRNEEIKELSFQFSYLFREEPSLPKIIIYGNVGTGKTCTIKYILRELKIESDKKQINLKIISIKGSESRTKYEVLRKIYEQLSELPIPNTTSELHQSIVSILAEQGLCVLIFIDEIHEIKESEINDTLFTISRLGEDIAYSRQSSTKKIVPSLKSRVGYILVSNDANIKSRLLKDNTRSSLTKDTLVFKRYSSLEIIEILKDRVEQGALYDGKLESGVLDKISGISVKECQDARYALILLLNVAKEAEKIGNDKITLELIDKVNDRLATEFFQSLIRDLPDLYLEILLIILELHNNEQVINSREIQRVYQTKTYLSNIHYTRIVQIVTDLEKNNILYVTTSRKTKLRNLSIEENIDEIKEVLLEKGKL
jgi:orc1/cdc6 family replication initiation protein